MVKEKGGVSTLELNAEAKNYKPQGSRLTIH